MGVAKIGDDVGWDVVGPTVGAALGCWVGEALGLAVGEVVGVDTAGEALG